MVGLFEALLIVAGVGILVPALVLFLECSLATFTQPSRTSSLACPRPAVVVLIPAHDEASVIGETIRSLRPALGDADRVLIVADNCTDGTAGIARAMGVDVIERHDPQRRGKGYALDFGVRHLHGEPPEVVVVMDADCVAHDQALALLASEALRTGRPVQARYILYPPGDAGPLAALSAFAVLVRNVVRQAGLARLGLPCPLFGTGMALPWGTISRATLATGALTEDLQLSADLALLGFAPKYCCEAVVSSPLPRYGRASQVQRERWEYGALATLGSRVPRLLWTAAARFDVGLLALALDMCVPPLSLLILGWGVTFVVAVALGMLGASWTPATLLALAGILILASVSASWARWGRSNSASGPC